MKSCAPNELSWNLKCTFLTGRRKKNSLAHTHTPASSWSGNQKWIRRLCIYMAWHFDYFPLIGIWYAAHVNLMRWKSSAISNFYTNASTVCIFDFSASFKFGGEPITATTTTSTQKWNNVKCDWSAFFPFISPLNPTKSNTRFFSRLL